MVSFLGLLGNNSSLLDFYLLNILAETGLDGLDDVGLVGLEGVEVPSSSDFELGDLGILLDEDGYVKHDVLFLAAFLVLSADLPSLSRFKNSLGFLISLGWIRK